MYCVFASKMVSLRSAAAAALAVAALTFAAAAETVVLRVSVVNPLDREQSKDIRSNLPAGIDAADVLDLDGMALRYDVAQDRYYVFQAVALAPRERRDFRVVMRDVWVLPEEDLALLDEQAGLLADRLQDTEFAGVASGLAGEIRATLNDLREDQARHAISAGARAADHISAYHRNRSVLDEVRDRIGNLENLVLGAGRDPGRLLGTMRDAPRPARTGAETAPPETGAVAIVITVRNTSPDRPRTVDLRRDLPREVRPRDVLDADGLEIGVDPARGGAVTVFRDGLELEPGATRSFEVRLRDRWNVYDPRIAELEETAARLLERVRAMQAYPSVEEFMEQAAVDIAALRDEPLPTEVDDRYVAFFRARGERVEELASRIARVEAALRPGQREQRLGFDVTPPDPRTTWLIIYVILGFLGVVSLLFFLRWYGRGR